MYEDYFHFSQSPFSIAPDPNFLYLSDGHSEALAHLMYGFSHGGFVLITGEVGTGKTTLLRNLVKQTPPELDVAFILNPRLTVKELLETLCDELGIPYPPAKHPTVKQYIDVLNKRLVESYRQGRSTVMIIDEAQNLSPAVLEQIRLLTNLETDERKLLRIILLGQPELGRMLERTELRQLAQRITARYHLGPLNREDCYAYVVHRLSRAGGDPQLFPRTSLALLFRLSRGIPRVLNVIADRALLGAYVEGRHRVSRRIVKRAAREVLGKRPRYRTWAVAGTASLLAAGLAGAYLVLPPERSDAPGGRQSAPPAQVRSSTAGAPQLPAETESASPREKPSGAQGLAAERPTRTQTSHQDPPAASPTYPAVSRPPMNRYLARRKAYIAAFAAWGADYAAAPRSIIPCNFAPSAGLQCLSLSGSWSDIEQLNLPVILELWDDETNPFHAAVLELQGESLTLHIGDTRISTTPRALSESWQGEFVLLWQTPPDYHGNLQRGDIHGTVGWLRQQLGGLVTEPLTTTRPNLFGAKLDAAVREFQSAEGLKIDGIVGPETWIKLASRLRLPAPQLGS